MNELNMQTLEVELLAAKREIDRLRNRIVILEKFVDALKKQINPDRPDKVIYYA